jgi:phosphohistidine phosphatase
LKVKPAIPINFLVHGRLRSAGGRRVAGSATPRERLRSAGGGRHTGPTMPTIELHLLRHAHAGNPLKWHGPDDDRPLSSKGRRQAERLGALLAAVGFTTGAIVTSPRVRARQTAEIVADRLGIQPTTDDRLAESLSLASFERVMADAGDPGSIVLVGHDPDFSELLGLLTGASLSTMRKGAIARIDAPRPLEPGSAVLRWLLPPELVPGAK